MEVNARTFRNVAIPSDRLGRQFGPYTGAPNDAGDSSGVSMTRVLVSRPNEGDRTALLGKMTACRTTNHSSANNNNIYIHVASLADQWNLPGTSRR
jgi:hypothetical protein